MKTHIYIKHNWSCSVFGGSFYHYFPHMRLGKINFLIVIRQKVREPEKHYPSQYVCNHIVSVSVGRLGSKLAMPNSRMNPGVGSLMNL